MASITGLAARAQDLLDCVELDPIACRTVIHPGPNVPFDVCSKGASGSDGQLWVSVDAITPGWPQPAGTPTSCTQQLTVTWSLGVVRCAATVDDAGQAPPATAVAADQAQQMADADALWTAVACCWPTSGRDLIIDRWDAIPPDGGCVGGVWTFRTTGSI